MTRNRPAKRSRTRRRCLILIALGVGLLGLPALSVVTAPPATADHEGDWRLVGLGDPGGFTFAPADGPVRVNVASGNLILTEDDLVAAPETSFIAFRRTYNSTDLASGPLGKGWTTSVGPQVRAGYFTTDGSMAYDGPSGEHVLFTETGSGIFTPLQFDGDVWRLGGTTGGGDPCSPGTRGGTGDECPPPAEPSGEVHVVTADGVELVFGEDGLLRDVTDGDGRTFSVQNSPDGAGNQQLRAYGTGTQRITVAYNGESRIGQIDDPTGQTRIYTYTDGLLTGYDGPGVDVTYRYDTSRQLTLVSYSDGRVYTIVPEADGIIRSLTISAPGVADRTFSYAVGRIPPSPGANPCDFARGDVAKSTVVETGLPTALYCANENKVVTSESPEVMEAAAQQYVADYGGNIVTARGWMEVQGRTDTVDEEIRATAAASGYSGLWLDNATRRIKVGLVFGTDPAPVQAVFDRHELGVVDVISTVYTEASLEDARPDVEDQLADLISSGLIATSINPATNSIEITIVASATSEDRSRIEQVARMGRGGYITTVDSPRANLALPRRACRGPNCDLPVRGGVKMWMAPPQDGWCTAGFWASRPSAGDPGRPSSGSRVMLTAGHCLNATNTQDQAWDRHTAAGAIWLFGWSGQRVWDSRGDAGTIVPVYITGKERPRSWVLVRDSGLTNRNEHYRIRGSAPTPVPGRYICLTGATSGSRCGRMISRNTTYSDGSNLARAAVCGVIGGDSGGSVYINHRAVGILNASSESDVPCNQQEMAFTSARKAEQLLGVTILGR